MKAYHLTERKNLFKEDGIAYIGLIPQCGMRSKRVNDDRICVCFTNDYYTLPLWKVYLYPDNYWDDLCVLSFDIEEEEIANFNNESEFFTNNVVPLEKINIVHFYNKRTKKEIPFFFLQRDKHEREGWGCDPIPIEIEVKEIPITELSLGISQFFKELSIKKLSITDEFFKYMTK